VQVSKLEDRLGSTTNVLTIENVCNELNLKYAHLRKTVEDKTESKKALLTMNCFKGKCTHCSKLRHKGSMCWYANGKDRKGKHGKKPMYKKHVTCFNCGKKGHYQSECPYDDHNERTNGCGKLNARSSAGWQWHQQSKCPRRHAG